MKDTNNTKQRFKELENLFTESVDTWTKTLHKSPYRMKDNEDFTDVLLDKVRHKYNISTTKQIKDAPLIGKVMKTSIDRYGQRFGFILRQPENVFFHALQNNQLDFINLEGKYVSYELVHDTKSDRYFAKNVQLTGE